MKILALDTATEACSVTLGVDGHSIGRYLEMERGHAEKLLPMVDELLAEAGIGLSALDAIAFGRGPGGFTGVRLAASVAQGLAFGAGVGVVPVSDLAAVAQRVVALQPGVRRILAAALPVIDQICRRNVLPNTQRIQARVGSKFFRRVRTCTHGRECLS